MAGASSRQRGSEREKVVMMRMVPRNVVGNRKTVFKFFDSKSSYRGRRREMTYDSLLTSK